MRESVDAGLTQTAPSGEGDTLPADLSHTRTQAPAKHAKLDAAMPGPGALVGRYVVVSKLGAGGMGVVLAAYDPELDRKVALKLLRGRSTPSAKARLQREAQALAKLDHPNVVAVYDVGVYATEAGGRLFIAMEFVEGQTLGAWMGQRQGEGPHPWREVLAVFAAAGRGLAAAHEVGLVHRDFKPDNVMLGKDGRVRVMDFGLARTEGVGGSGDWGDPELASSEELPTVTSSLGRESERLTQTGALLGTPAYMSAEQLSGEAADARSDQFAFCVALYEALFGGRPFAGRTFGELAMTISEGRILEPPKGRAVPGWLRKVVWRGLARDPGQRFASMTELLAALEVEPEGRRNWWAGGLALVVALGLVTWGVLESRDTEARPCAGLDGELAGVWDEPRKTQVREALLGTEADYSADTAERVERHLDAYARGWLDARVATCEATQRGEESRELLDRRLACLDDRRDHLGALVDVLAEADAKVVARAVHASLGLPPLERCHDTEALLAEVPPPDDPDTAKQVEALERRHTRATELNEAGKYEDALAEIEAIVAESEPLGYAPFLARAKLLLGEVQEQNGDYAAAVANLADAYDLALREQMISVAAQASAQLVWVEGERRARHEEGRRWAIHAGPLAEATGTPHAQARFSTNLGNVAFAEGKYEEAARLYAQVVAIREQMAEPVGPDGPYPEEPLLAVAYHNVANVHLVVGEFDEAEANYERAIAINERAFGPTHPNLGMSLHNLGILSASQRDFGPAREYLERTLKIWEAELGPDHVEVSHCLDNLGSVNKSLGNDEQALDYYLRALEIRRDKLGPEHPDTAQTLSNLADMELAAGRYEQALARYEEVLALKEASLGTEHPSLAFTLGGMGNTLGHLGRHEEALAVHRRGAAIREQALGSEHVLYAVSITDVASSLHALGRYEEALPLLELALPLRGEDGAGYTGLLLANVLWDAPAGGGRDRARAREEAQRALEASKTAPDPLIAERSVAAAEAWLAAHPE